jgi:hypothetical protein
MSNGATCKCPESKKPLEQRKWSVVQYKQRCSAFDGYRTMRSDYSAVFCSECNKTWRTKAAYVDKLRCAHTVCGERCVMQDAAQ